MQCVYLQDQFLQNLITQFYPIIYKMINIELMSIMNMFLELIKQDVLGNVT